MTNNIRSLVLAAQVFTTKGLLRVVGFRRTIRLLSNVPKSRKPVDQDWMRSRSRALAAVRVPGGSTCLDRSVLLWAVGVRRGLAPELRVGVARENAGLDAHAWVELGGVVMNDDADVATRYAVFDRDPTAWTFR